MTAFRKESALIAVLALLAASAVCGCGESDGSQRARWQPRPTVAPWQWQLQGRIDTGVDAGVYEVDGIDTPRRTVRALHRRGRKVICYLDVGSWESYRPDARSFPRAAIGSAYEGYPDERWLDVSRLGLIAKPLQRRFEICARKGFDAVEPDNVNGWENPTGFRITPAEQLRFNRWVAGQAHRLGMAVALKNDGRQARRLVGAFDFAVTEQCFQYDECGLYRTFVRHGKAVFDAEYGLPPRAYCARAKRLRFSAIRKTDDLNAEPWTPCAAPEGGGR